MHQTMLPFLTLAESHPGVTDAIGAFYAEAARVCLGRHHQSPAEFRIECPSGEHTAIASWTAVDARTIRSWANETDATESGAYGIALAALQVTEGLVAVRRAETLTGADYYVAPAGADVDDLEAWFRLEVSGVDRGDDVSVRSRLRGKIKQALSGASNLPALGAVVGFRAKFVAVAKAEAQ